MTASVVTARAPGRVNLIGDHTDYTGGLVLPMAIDRWTTVRARPGGGRVLLRSDADPDPLDVALPALDPHLVEPAWGRYVAAVAAEMNARVGLEGTVSSTVPAGAGLSSSAALEVAVALALGAPHADHAARVALAELCQRAEHRATAVPCGIMDQLTSVAGVPDHALLIDCHDRSVTPVPMPPDVEVVVRFVTHRTLAGSEYADRVAQCRAAEEVIGPLRLASAGDWDRLTDPLLRGRARHVITENERVRRVASAFRQGDLVAAGKVLTEGHASLRDDFATSTPAMDAAVHTWLDVPGVFGARMTGGGFGGCIVALATPGTLRDGWVVRAVGGAGLVEEDPGPTDR